MFQTPPEIATALGTRIRTRRLGLGWSQAEAAERAGVAYRTWRRMETEGKASIDDLIRAAIALRCEPDFEKLFPQPAATSMDALLEHQRRETESAPKRVRAPRRPA